MVNLKGKHQIQNDKQHDIDVLKQLVAYQRYRTGARISASRSNNDRYPGGFPKVMKHLLFSCLFTSLIQMPVMAQELRGFADIHNHQFANLAFGGKIVVGQAYGPISEALSPSLDRGNHGPEHIRDFLGGLMAERGLPGIHELLEAPYSNEGFPSFSGWPNFWEVTHQKVYQDWLFRAVQGGLRLVVMLAVDSPALCRSTNNDGRNCNDEMATIDLQINAAKAMQEFIDQQSGGNGRGWYRIVTTPAEARRVIRQGKLAVVLGIETAHLFNCRSGAPCDWQGRLQEYWEKGVRHFFIIHQDDNAFGGASYFQPWIQRQRNWLGDQPKRIIAPYALTTRPCPQYARGRCNWLGLTDTGRSLIQELMRLGAIIDVDHMSDRAFAETLDLAEHRGYPVVASHAGFNEINNGDQDHEGQLTLSELQRIHRVGGMIGLILGQGGLKEVDTWKRPGRHEVSHICGGTTETFAQAYYYVLDRAPGMPIAVGTDFNGPLIQPGPRFGPNKCPGGQDRSRQKWEERLIYPFLSAASQTRLGRLRSGDRTFDFNYDGLIHVGLLPDFFADLKVLGVAAQDLEPLFNSAEGYIQVWEKALGRKAMTEEAAISIFLFGIDEE